MSLISAILTRLGLRKDWSHAVFKTPPTDRAGIQKGLIKAISAKAGIPAEKVATGNEFAQFGFDSLSLVAFTAKLEDWLHIKLEPTTMWDYPTINTLVVHLADELGFKLDQKAG